MEMKKGRELVRGELELCKGAGLYLPKGGDAVGPPTAPCGCSRIVLAAPHPRLSGLHPILVHNSLAFEDPYASRTTHWDF